MAGPLKPDLEDTLHAFISSHGNDLGSHGRNLISLLLISLATGLFSQCTESPAFALKIPVTTSFKILQVWAAIFEVGPLTLRSILGKSLGYQPITSLASTHHPKMHLFSSYSPLRIQLTTSLTPSLVGPCFLHSL